MSDKQLEFFESEVRRLEQALVQQRLSYEAKEKSDSEMVG